MDGRPTITVPVMQPLLPGGEFILPYLKRIDANRWYSNFGPLCMELENRLAARWHTKGASVLTLVNGTSGLTATLLAAGAAGGTLCLMPAWTFIATAHAATGAGLTPFLADVDPVTGCLTPALAEAALAAAPGPVGAVLPVCPFGAPVDWAGWEDFRRRTGIPVVIDAASAFDSVQAGPLPAVVSLHATKVLGAGEGGILVCDDAQLVARARRHSCFGFLGNRVGRVPAMNAKMSEYHAAVALASLDCWAETRSQWAGALDLLHKAVQGLPGMSWPAGLGDSYVVSTPTIRVPDAAALTLHMRGDGIETRQWWQGGLKSHPAFADAPATALPVTEHLSKTSLGLPCWLGMNTAVTDRIAQSITRYCAPV